MKRCHSLLFVLAILAWTTTTQAAVSNYETYLDGPSESPPNASPGTGFGQFSYDDAGHTFSIDVSFSGLLGTTTAAHIHAPTPIPFGMTAGVATTTPFFAGFPIGVTSGTYMNTLDLTQNSSWNPSYITANGGTTAGAETAFISAINAGKAYFNIHTQLFSGGEIRGFLRAVPEPATCGLASLGIAALVGAARRRRS